MANFIEQNVPCIVLLSALACSAAAGAWGVQQTMVHGGTNYMYSTYVPSTASTGMGANGMVLFLHGLGAKGDPSKTDSHWARWDVSTNAGACSFIGVVPMGGQGSAEDGYMWNDEDPPPPDDVGFLNALVLKLKAQYKLGASAHVLVSGFSNGAGTAMRAGCNGKLEERLALAATGTVRWQAAADQAGACL